MPNSCLSQTVIDRAEQWATWDPNVTTARILRLMLSQSDPSIATLFPDDESRIGFGTAGLRSEMSIGPLGMNDLVVVQTAQGLAHYCRQQQQQQQLVVVASGSNTEERLKVVIGYDHRARTALNLSSISFAILSALVFEQAGMECILLHGLVHTPLVAFSTTKQKAALGIMITASHNPKDDAGYKVYWQDGVQIRPPVDKGMAQAILANLEPWVDYKQILYQRQLYHGNKELLGLSNKELTNQLVAEYFDAIKTSGLVTGQAQISFGNLKPPKFAYTAMHGVGTPFAQRGFKEFGFAPFEVVPTQASPDPTFPTVVFPNPEEKGALDIAIAFAEETHCDIVFANDPDADRLALAERDRVSKKWTVFTGDQIGTMLGHWLWLKLRSTSKKVNGLLTSFINMLFLFQRSYSHLQYVFMGSLLPCVHQQCLRQCWQKLPKWKAFILKTRSLDLSGLEQRHQLLTRNKGIEPYFAMKKPLAFVAATLFMIKTE